MTKYELIYIYFAPINENAELNDIMKHHEDEIIKLKDDWMPAEINFR
jgi:hypothetical protein